MASLAEATKIVSDALAAEGPPWPEPLRNRVRQWIFDDDCRQVSVFEVDTGSLFDMGHALGVVAATIGSGSLDVQKRDEQRLKLTTAVTKLRDPGRPERKQALQVSDDSLLRSVATFTFLETTICRYGTLEFAPDSNTCFAPADDRHYDYSASDLEGLVTAIIGEIRENSSAYAFLAKPDYRTQCAVALSGCILDFGSLDSSPPRTWPDSDKLSATEQVERLKTLSGYYGKLRYPDFHVK